MRALNWPIRPLLGADDEDEDRSEVEALVLLPEEAPAPDKSSRVSLIPNPVMCECVPIRSSFVVSLMDGVVTVMFEAIVVLFAVLMNKDSMRLLL